MSFIWKFEKRPIPFKFVKPSKINNILNLQLAKPSIILAKKKIAIYASIKILKFWELNTENEIIEYCDKRIVKKLK